MTSAECNGLTLVAVTLNDRNDWADHKKLYEYGFSYYKVLGEGNGNTAYTVKVAGSQKDSVSAQLSDDAKTVVPADKVNDIECRVYLPSMVFAPVKKGISIRKGSVHFYQKIKMYTYT